MEKLEQLYEGKAKKVFKTDDPELLIVEYKDDATAFNGLKKGTIAGKGVINNEMSNRLMAMLEKQGIPTHFVKELDSRQTLVKKVSIVPLEVIVRNISAGSFAKHYGVELPALMFGYEPRMNSYFLTRKDKGVAVERTKAYKYQSLAAGFVGRKADPFLVTVHPKPEDEPMYLNSHPGQEYNMVLKGRLLLQINNKDLILEEGDSIYFNSELPHGMKALDGEKVSFLAVIL